MMPLLILLAAVISWHWELFFPKSFTGAFSSNSCLDVREVWAKSNRASLRYFGMKFLAEPPRAKRARVGGAP